MNWDEIKNLKKEIEQCIYTSNLHFRYQLLKVTCQMKVSFSIKCNKCNNR